MVIKKQVKSQYFLKGVKAGQSDSSHNGYRSTQVNKDASIDVLQRKMKEKTGSLVHGMVAGLLVPAIFFVIIVLFRKNEESLLHYISVIYGIGIVPKLISLCLIPNLILFFYFIQINRLKNARGVIFAMFIYGAIILITKFA